MKKYINAYKNDIILFIILLSIGIIAFILLNSFSVRGAYVSVREDGKVIDMLDLSENTTRKINLIGHNTICISDGKVYMQEADCPDKLCVNMKPISKTGQTIICLPHKLVIEIVDQSPDSEIDAISE